MGPLRQYSSMSESQIERSILINWQNGRAYINDSLELDNRRDRLIALDILANYGLLKPFSERDIPASESTNPSIQDTLTPEEILDIWDSTSEPLLVAFIYSRLSFLVKDKALMSELLTIECMSRYLATESMTQTFFRTCLNPSNPDAERTLRQFTQLHEALSRQGASSRSRNDFFPESPSLPATTTDPTLTRSEEEDAENEYRRGPN